MPAKLYNSEDYCSLAEEFEACKIELYQWKQIAKILSEELTATREENSSICWEDVDESSYAQILYKQLLEKTQ